MSELTPGQIVKLTDCTPDHVTLTRKQGRSWLGVTDDGIVYRIPARFLSEFSYSPWRHGGWYVDNVRYPNGAVGCVAWDYDDNGKRTGRYRIACDSRRGNFTYPTRDAAARAERDLIAAGILA